MYSTMSSQKENIIEVSEKVVRYANEGPSAEDALKPYYLYRLTPKNEFKEYLIGYKVVLSNIHGKSSHYRAVGYEKIKDYITRSKRQIEDDDISKIKPKHIPIPILGEKINGKWEVFLKDSIGLQFVTISTDILEGRVYIDSVWLQSYDRDYALKLLIANKKTNIEKLKQQIDAQDEKIITLEKILHNGEINYE